MRSAPSFILAALVLAAALVPEARRYATERQLRRLTTAFQLVVNGAGSSQERARLLDAVAGAAAEADHPPTADSRALILAGSAHLVARRASTALAFYRRALERGERAEIDLNIARAYALLRRTEAADAALLRAIWVSPTLVAALPRRDRAPWRHRLKRMRFDLRRGRLAGPPPLPEGDAP